MSSEHLAFILFTVVIAGFVWIPLTWLLLSIFTPKSLLERYFKEPHFTLTETYMLKEFPGFLMRTSIWGWALVTPFLDRKRNIKNVSDYMPLWYAIGLRVLTIGATFTLVVMFALMTFLLLLPESYGSEVTLFTIPWPL